LNLTGLILDLFRYGSGSQKTRKDFFERVLARCSNLTGLIPESPVLRQRLFRVYFWISLCPSARI